MSRLEQVEKDAMILTMKRKKLHIRQVDIAKKLGVCKQAINLFESYRSSLSDETIKKYYELVERMECEK
ncbi:helix-turn-helix transcriptional regulator [Clostridium botulinum]|nr:helix-turn-helix transcriptional regulator [Clostridium botulinum]NFM10378.1 helix-turn-helix transcriptional regulator [Clostridium botulinum]NFO73253.1 helix-turn-helix transcriptional regulator [Clostridium botulinum]